jgi:hypothetical protein
MAMSKSTNKGKYAGDTCLCADTIVSACVEKMDHVLVLYSNREHLVSQASTNAYGLLLIDSVLTSPGEKS